MTKKLSTRLLYGLVISIIVLMTGFLGLGIRAFASAVISDSIFLAAFGILLMIFPIYFILHRPPAVTVMDRKIRRLLSARSGQVPPDMASGRYDRRRPLVQGQVLAAVAHERRTKQLAGFRDVGLEPITSETVNR
jgi:hypothetical protein